ncbi:hypothetical protein DICPUDRAFT_152762 [Dictyostelium purpureum]|uniref:EF-hand domain-containing protein n=1 Tax=Dictyostelium purpureum TaxID=5786 RepID=F0ZM78_DICPU|nr:uncharacterized protein DICPUDRAFT_152762 [Dictyostelium purpureum]EGC34947.1 hypothetical protein DICPUDRAFT_152762 [Dictyostelium purpureum]|eukprot:XP_003288528.1 hypothetical protein DICPUDRAFT_152762 [Dictyostelium purpureum]
MGNNQTKQDFRTLAQTSRLDHSELKELLKQFKSISKNGEIKKEDIKSIIEKKYGGSESSLSNILFNLFDKDNSKGINFQEFCLAYGFLVNKSLDDVIEVSFKCLDLNGVFLNCINIIFYLNFIYIGDSDGHISRNELRAVVMMNKKMEKYLRVHKKQLPLDKITFQPIEVSKINEEADTLFQRLDINKDGEVSKEEFISLASADSSLKQQLTSYLVKDETLDFFN